MSRKSSIERLPKPIRDRVAALLRDNRMTLDEIVDELRTQFGAAPSRSALGRYKQTFEDAVAKQREMESISDLWIQQVKDAPQGKMGRMVLELLRTVAMQSALNAQSKDHIDPKELAHIARAFNLIESAGKREAENRALLREEIRQELLKEQGDKLDGMAAAGKFSPEVLARIRQEIYGL